ncbi:unnamed protein product [Calypogeia fissa]
MDTDKNTCEENAKEIMQSIDPRLDVITLADERGGRRRGKNLSSEEELVDLNVGEEEPADELVEDNSLDLTLDSKINDPRGCHDGYILLVKESLKTPPSGKISLGPLPYLGLFTAFGQKSRVSTPPKVQSRWNLVKVPLRREFGPRCPLNKYAHPRKGDPLPSKDYQRPLIPMDPKKRRRILHHFPITGDKRHMFKLLVPSGFYRRKTGGGWICRKWIKRPWPRKLINHTKEEWKATLVQKEKKEKLDDEKFQTLLHEVWNGIIGLDQGIVKETFMRLVKDNERRSEKRQDMYDQWDLSVFNYIQRQTQDQINNETYDPHVVTAKQMDLQRKYCKAWQRRKVFLDIIHPEEYDPYEYRDTAMKYTAKNLYDPIKHDWLKEREEKVFCGENVPKKHRSRETLELANWQEPEFKACMAGHVCCDNELGERKHLAAVPEKWISNPVLYNKRWGPEFWHTSFPKGGKMCDGPRPGDQKDATEVPWRGIQIVWDAPPKLQPKLQISEQNPWF